MERYRVDPPSGYRPRYTSAPGQKVLTITSTGDSSESHLTAWGVSTGRSHRVINARVETIHEKPLFRDLFPEHRCLIPASGYFEWKHEGSHKSPYYFSSGSEPLISFAGLIRPSPDGDQMVILTTGATPPYSEIHDRMPVILNPIEEMRYLVQGEISLIPEVLGFYEVSPRVNAVSEDGPGVIVPWRPHSAQQTFGDIGGE